MSGAGSVHFFHNGKLLHDPSTATCLQAGSLADIALTSASDYQITLMFPSERAMWEMLRW